MLSCVYMAPSVILRIVATILVPDVKPRNGGTGEITALNMIADTTMRQVVDSVGNAASSAA